MIRLSVVVPFYNVESYIEQCIRSLYDQNIPYDEYEVICVDDRAPDGSRTIVQRLQHEFPTLRLICHDVNKKQGAARNTGLRAAKGEYVWFVDSDDYVMPNIYRALLDEVENSKVEVLQFNNIIVNLSGDTICAAADYEDEKVYDGISYIVNQEQELWSARIVPWKSLYNRSFLLYNRLFFEENVPFEDTDWSLNLYRYVKSIKHKNLTCYVYRYNNQSICHITNTPQKIGYQVLLLKRVQKLLRLENHPQYKELLYKYIHNELSQLGSQAVALPFKQRLIYARMMHKYKINILKNSTSFKNWLRVKYGFEL